MKIPFAGGSTCYAVSFEIVVEGLDPGEAPTLRELEFGVFAKTGRIWVEKGTSVSKRLQNKLGGGNLVCELGPFLAGVADTQFEEGLYGQPTAL